MDPDAPAGSGVVVVICLIVPGKPKGKARPRFDRATGRVYTDSATESAEERVVGAWARAGEPRIEGRVGIRMNVTGVLARPQSHYRVNGTLSSLGERTPIPLKKPDFDNLAKLMGDALNGLAYEDDVLIASCLIVKRWAAPQEIEHVRIELQEVAEMQRGLEWSISESAA